MPITRDTKPHAEAELLGILRGACDGVVLARYIQILSGRLPRTGRCSGDQHSPLVPARVRGRRALRGRQRTGVKLIGATAHYGTEELDAGPTIEQDVIRASHRQDVETLTRRGADIESTVLSRAVEWHCQDRILRHSNTTVVF